MLTTQKGCGCDHGDLLARHDSRKGSTHGDLSLAKPDIAADKTIHRFASRKVIKRIADRTCLVLGFGKREACAELVIGAFRGLKCCAFAQVAFGSDLDQLACHVADAFTQLGLTRLPRNPTQLIKDRDTLVRAIT